MGNAATVTYFPRNSTPLGVVGVSLEQIVSHETSYDFEYDLQNSGAAAKEMPGIVVCMEADQVAVKDP